MTVRRFTFTTVERGSDYYISFSLGVMDNHGIISDNTLANVVTKSDGTFVASGIAANSISTGWTIQAHYNGNVNYISSDSKTQT